MKNSFFRHYNEHLPIKTKVKIDKTKFFRLDLAEGLIMPSPKVSKVLKNTINEKDLAALPDRECLQLKEAVAKFVKCNLNNVSIFAGSDEIIELIPRIYLEPGDIAVTVTPVFQRLIQTNYKMGAEVCLIETKPENSFNISDENYSQIKDCLTKGAKLAWFCTPNNPTGVVYDKKLILSLIKKYPNTMFVIDEVYQEYYSLEPRDSYASYVNAHKNLIVLRSFSKAFGLAGLRIGYVVSNSKNISDLDSFKIMYSLSYVSQRLALAALKDLTYVKKTVDLAKKERNRVVTEVTKKNKNLEIISESKTSLIFIRHKKIDIFKRLIKNGYLASDWRNASGVENEGFVRITIGTKSYNDKLIRMLISL